MFDSEYWKKVGKGLLIAMAGAFLTYLTSTVFPSLAESGNQWALPLVAVFSTLVNAAQKLLLDQK